MSIRDFILERELAEVYLLLDNIATGQSKTLPVEIDDPTFGNPGTGWLQDICKIVWPPDPNTIADQAGNAAKLLRAKDALNCAAAPATGASIAFTVLLSDEARFPIFHGEWWRRLLSASLGRDGDGHERDGTPTRISLAAQAYPSLARKAWRYRAGTYLLVTILLASLVLTCLLSWDVATGSALLNRVNALDAQKQSAAAGSDVTTKDTAPSPAAKQQASTSAPATPPGAAGASSAGGEQGALPAAGHPPAAEQKADGVGKAAPPPAFHPSPPQLPRKDDDAAGRLSATRDEAARNLGIWLQDQHSLRAILTARMGGAAEPPVPDNQVNVEWAAVFVGILANTILPIFYGLLGAGAAVVRIVSDRMRDSTLMPRHIRLAFMQLALGAVIGACVGLFVTPDGGATQTPGGLLGAVHLSASALCFVAGFGVEGVFQALESLVRRVFSLDSAKLA